MLPFFGKKSLTYLFAWIDVVYQVAYKFEIWLDKQKRKEKPKDIFFFYCSFFALQVYQKLTCVVDARLTIDEYGNNDFDQGSNM